MILAIDWMQYAIYFLYASLLAVLAIIGYRYLLRRWNKQPWKREDFVELFSLEHQEVRGEVSFFFEVFSSKHITFVLVNSSGSEVAVLVDEERKPGGHVIRFDTTSLPNGTYYYRLTTANQRTEKRVEIRN
jgi:histidinol-phosphate/aromatic aminotransferase/cobyric acid decarboxylase-like protein